MIKIWCRYDVTRQERQSQYSYAEPHRCLAGEERKRYSACMCLVFDVLVQKGEFGIYLFCFHQKNVALRNLTLQLMLGNSILIPGKSIAALWDCLFVLLCIGNVSYHCLFVLLYLGNVSYHCLFVFLYLRNVSYHRWTAMAVSQLADQSILIAISSHRQFLPNQLFTIGCEACLGVGYTRRRTIKRS